MILAEPVHAQTGWLDIKIKWMRAPSLTMEMCNEIRYKIFKEWTGHVLMGYPDRLLDRWFFFYMQCVYWGGEKL